MTTAAPQPKANMGQPIPRYDAVATVRDFAAKTDGRRVGPPLTAGALAGRLTGIRS